MERVDQALAQVRALGIDHEVSLIFGLPQQTLASFEASVAWCLEHHIPVIKAFPLLLLRGTQLDRERHRWGLETDGSAMSMVNRSSTFSRAEWTQMSRLSDALHRTEGRHPMALEGLRKATCQPAQTSDRWCPLTVKEAA